MKHETKQCGGVWGLSFPLRKRLGKQILEHYSWITHFCWCVDYTNWLKSDFYVSFCVWYYVPTKFGLRIELIWDGSSNKISTLNMKSFIKDKTVSSLHQIQVRKSGQISRKCVVHKFEETSLWESFLKKSYITENWLDGRGVNNVLTLIYILLVFKST